MKVLDAISAELIKLLRMRATWLLAWIYPIVFVLFFVGVLIYGISVGHAPTSPVDAAKWSQESANFWLFPQTAFGRYLVASFAVFCTASEYGWNTWKLVVPLRPRWQLLGAKMVVSFLLLLVAFVATGFIAVGGAALNAVIVGPEVPDGVTARMVLDEHLRGMVSVAAPTIYTLVLATLLSVLTRSALGALLISVALVTLEGLLPMSALFAFKYAPSLTEFAVQVLPFYHLANVMNWSNHGAALALPLGGTVAVSAGLGKSLAIVSAWTALLIGAAMTHFTRQDLD